MILFELHFQIDDQKRAEFEQTFAQVFTPAISKQRGFQSLKLLKLYPAATVSEIEASPTEYDYQINFTFETEAARRVWATSPEHDAAWPQLSALARKFLWRGYDVLASQ